MKIVISTGVFPPEIGGPAEYARQLSETLRIQNHDVIVTNFAGIRSLPTGIRHIVYFFRVLTDAWDADYIIALDTFSVALPSVVLARILGKKVVLRVGGDFLWEAYIDRTGEPILLSEFYDVKRSLTLKEKIILNITRGVFSYTDGIVFSTSWQRDIMTKPYRLQLEKTQIIENQYSVVQIKPRLLDEPKVFLSPSRDRKIKNKKNVEEAFKKVQEKFSDIVLDTRVVSHEVLMEKMQHAYAVVVASLSEVSPNLVLDSIKYGVPVVVTQDTGIRDRLRDLAIFVDPRSVLDIAQGIESLLNTSVYDAYAHKIQQNTYTHSWNEIAQEFIDFYLYI